MKLFENIEGIATLRDEWEMLQYHPNADYEFYMTIVRAREQNGVSPCVFVIEGVSGIEAILAGRISRERRSIRLGYLHFPLPKVRVLRIIYGGCMSRDRDAVNGNVVRLIWKTLRAKRIALAEVGPVEMDSFFLSAVKKGVPWLFQGRFVKRQSHYSLALSKDPKDILSHIPGKRRRKLYREKRLFEEKFSGVLSYRVIQKPSEVEELCLLAEEVASQSYHRRLNVGFRSDAETRARLLLEAQRGRLLAVVAVVRGRPAAFWVATSYQGTLYLDWTGYVREYGRYSIGTVLLIVLLEVASGSGTMSRIDFGFGGGQYKEVFSDEMWEEKRVEVWAPTVGGLMLCWLSSGGRFVGVLIEAVGRWFGVEQRVKSLWRQILARKG